MTYKFFTAKIETLEELRKEYKRLVFLHHPDKGGRTEDMQQINAEYDELLKIVGNVRRAQDGSTYTKTGFSAMADNFREIIEKIISFDIKIEICGSWIWVDNGYSYREDLKRLGFFWCSSKKLWAWTNEPSNNKHRLTMEEIRNMHGSEIVKNKTPEKLEGGAA